MSEQEEFEEWAESEGAYTDAQGAWYKALTRNELIIEQQAAELAALREVLNIIFDVLPVPSGRGGHQIAIYRL